MQILLNSDNHITGTVELTNQVEAEVQHSLERFADRITRVEVHIKDVNSHKGGGDDVVCTMEARPRGHSPVAVTERGATPAIAVSAAAATLQSALQRTFGRLDERSHERG